jgi:hypothetical protein
MAPYEVMFQVITAERMLLFPCSLYKFKKQWIYEFQAFWRFPSEHGINRMAVLCPTVFAVMAGNTEPACGKFQNSSLFDAHSPVLPYYSMRGMRKNRDSPLFPEKERYPDGELHGYGVL